MRDRDKALKWLADQSKNPTQSWKGLCQSSCRQAWSMPAYGSSAKVRGLNVKDKYKVLCEDYRDKSWWQHIPAGAIIYSNGGPNSKYGHAWIAAGDMTGWSVDYKRSGYIDLVEIRLKGWTSYYQNTDGYILGAQYYEGDGWFKGIEKGYWDSKIPPLENVMLANDDRTLANAAVWRLACRLHDIGFGNWKNPPVKYEQTYPVKAMEEYNRKHAPGMDDLSQYGPKAHDRIFIQGK